MAKCKYCGLNFDKEEELQAHKEKSHKSMMKLELDSSKTSGDWQSQASK